MEGIRLQVMKIYMYRVFVLIKLSVVSVIVGVSVVDIADQFAVLCFELCNEFQFLSTIKSLS